MRVLYHFAQSVFSRRTRLALAHKGLDVELRDGRADPSFMAEARQLTPLRTMPVLVDEGRALGDSGAIVSYLDFAYPDRPRLWPLDASAAHDALGITTAIDVAMNALADMGTRYWDLRNDPAWERVVGERMARAKTAIEWVAAKATRPFLAGDAWGAAEIWTFSATRWVLGMPPRAATTPLVAQILTLDFELPKALVDWSKQHDDRPEVRAIYG
ncbi:MAG TPA: glutathione S-transferase family protein [Labilithrix sp.]|jgi:glutathione S-transferase|nr:glutathione S-transferase family protein [Labilithrix sp.]